MRGSRPSLSLSLSLSSLIRDGDPQAGRQATPHYPSPPPLQRFADLSMVQPASPDALRALHARKSTQDCRLPTQNLAHPCCRPPGHVFHDQSTFLMEKETGRKGRKYVCIYLFLSTNVKKLQHFIFYCPLFYMNRVAFDHKSPFDKLGILQTP